MKNEHKTKTKILHIDNDIAPTKGTVNPPVHHASTILFDSYDSYKKQEKAHLEKGQSVYGIHGSSIQFSLAKTINELESGHDTIVTSSGLLAITLALGSVLNTKDHLLMSDSVYGPTRRFCDRILRANGIAVDYYDPRNISEIESLINNNTKVIFLESPGSYTFEVQDIPAITHLAKQHDIITMCDNTWATPLYFQPISHGVDIVIHAVTKYISGHSDVMMGSITCNEKLYPHVHDYAKNMGNHAAPDDCYLAMRGLRTLPIRLKQHERNGYAVAKWLADRNEVVRMIHPGREDHPDHALWQRDFSGASSLFGFCMKPIKEQSLANMLDNMQLFGMGFSWGGYESLLIPANLKQCRSKIPFNDGELLMRIHIGLEHVEDLINDLDDCFDRIKAKKSFTLWSSNKKIRIS